MNAVVILPIGASKYQSAIAKMELPPNSKDGWFLENMLFFGRSASKETVLSKGAIIELPPLSGMSEDGLNDFQQRARGLLMNLCRDNPVQIQWQVDSDYSAELENYKNITDTKATNPFVKYVRREKYYRYMDKMEEGTLRREKLAIFLSAKCDTTLKGFRGNTDAMKKFLEQQNRNFMQRFDALKTSFPEWKIKPMNDRDHWRYCMGFHNPSLVVRNIRDEAFDPRASIFENCIHSDGISTKRDDMVCFHYDGHYHGVLVLKRWPQQTYPGIILRLTNAVGLNYCISQNIYPVDIRQEIDKEEDRIRRLRSDIHNENKLSYEEPIRQKMEKLASLQRGYTFPYKCLTVIRAWDKTIEGLNSRLAALKSSLQNMFGAQYHHCNHPAQANNLFFETFPGWTGGAVRQWDMYAESDYLCDMIPLSSSFNGFLEEGEALYEGERNELVGVRTFVRTEDGAETPQHTLVLGAAGSGKSVTMVDILAQSEPFYEFTVLIEEGLSYQTYTQAMGCEPIILKADGEITINYFDTGGLPLSDLNKSIGRSLCLVMSGMSQNDDDNKLRSSMFGEYIDILYWDFFKAWSRKNSRLMPNITRLAYCIDRLPANSNDSFLDKFLEMREIKRVDEERFQKIFRESKENDILAWSKTYDGETKIRDLAYSEMKPTDMPIHSSLVEVLRSPLERHQKTEALRLSTLLSAWQRSGGSNGRLFDGVTTVNMQGKVLHFELGYIPSQAKDLKQAAGFLVSNFARQRIISMPRAVRKRLVFEEMSRFLLVPGGDLIISEAYAQLRKFACWVASITQQYEQFRHSSLRSVITGNSSQYFLLRQNNRDDLEDFAGPVRLPPTYIDRIMNYPKPEHQSVEDRAGYFCQYIPGGAAGDSICGTVKNIASPELLYVAASNGENFDKRQKALRQYIVPGEKPEVSITRGIMAEVEKREAEAAKRKAV